MKTKQSAHVLEAAVDPRQGAVLSPCESDVLGLVVLTDEIDYRVSICDGSTNAFLVCRAVQKGCFETSKHGGG